MLGARLTPPPGVGPVTLQDMDRAIAEGASGGKRASAASLLGLMNDDRTSSTKFVRLRTRRVLRLTYAPSMSKVLLDTDILSESLKGKSAVVTSRARTYSAQQGNFTTSAVSAAEIVYGLRRVGREDRLARFEGALETAEVPPLDERRGAPRRPN